MARIRPVDKAKVGGASVAVSVMGFITCFVASIASASRVTGEEEIEANELGMAHTAGFFVLSSTSLMVLIFFSADMLMVRDFPLTIPAF
jgi:uncharacterized membrane protein